MKQFDLEQAIMQCWSVCDDLHMLSEAIIEDKADKDTLCNVVTGMAELYHLKFDKLFCCFEDFIKEKQQSNSLEKNKVIL